MGTRSRIGIMNDDGTITSVYCHWDGYLEHNGKLLREHWSDEKKLRKMMKIGDMSVLGEEIGKKHDFKNAEGARGNGCTFYKRDRGEKNVDAKVHPNFDAFRLYFEEYNYLFYPKQGKWEVNYHRTGGAMVSLEEAMEHAWKSEATAGAD